MSENFGLADFVPIFKTLYKDLRSDIIINGKIATGYKLLRGVKQGDALSCILFIMCMEPLLRNIDESQNIEQLDSVALESPLPKSYAYADDVNVVLKNNPNGLQEIFNEYGRLTRASGLELNADKTEIMQLNRRNLNENDVMELSFDINYCGREYRLKTCKKIKVNGISFQQNLETLKNENVDSAVKRIDATLKRWAARHLSTLGKILIAKTFGISQVIYIMQTFELNDDHFKRINKVLYKFIWNRHYAAAKAPERIKREITNKPVHLGGLGMLDIIALDKGLKLRALARLFDTRHPFLALIRDKIDWEDYFHPISRQGSDGMSCEGIKILRELRRNTLEGEWVGNDRKAIAVIKNIRLEKIISNVGKNSIAYFTARRSGATKVRDLNLNLNGLGRFITNDLRRILERVIGLPEDNNFILTGNYKTCFVMKNKFVDMRKFTNKELRNALVSSKPIEIFKSGVVLTTNESINWGAKLRKVTSVRHRNTLLRVIHAEVYTKERQHRFGLSDPPNCAKCGELEDLEHKLFRCDYAKRIWDRAIPLTNKLKEVARPSADRLQTILGVTIDTNKEFLAVHGEILTRILYLKEEAQYLVHPRTFVELAIKYVARNEKSETSKTKLEALLAG